MRRLCDAAGIELDDKHEFLAPHGGPRGAGEVMGRQCRFTVAAGLPNNSEEVVRKSSSRIEARELVSDAGDAFTNHDGKSKRDSANGSDRTRVRAGRLSRHDAYETEPCYAEATIYNSTTVKYADRSLRTEFRRCRKGLYRLLFGFAPIRMLSRCKAPTYSRIFFRYVRKGRNTEREFARTDRRSAITDMSVTLNNETTTVRSNRPRTEGE